jgi:hypothetical protein
VSSSSSNSSSRSAACCLCGDEVGLGVLLRWSACVILVRTGSGAVEWSVLAALPEPLCLPHPAHPAATRLLFTREAYLQQQRLEAAKGARADLVS